MPITNTLKTAEEFRRTGFTQEQSNLLAQKFEETAQAFALELKDFIRAENAALRVEMTAFRNEMRAELAALEMRFDAKLAEVRLEIEKVRAELHSGLRDQMVKFVTILVGVVSVAVAIIKLFPNLH